MKTIGQRIEDKRIEAGDGDEWLACEFVNCVIVKIGKCKFYDCNFDTCQFQGFEPSDFGGAISQ